MATKQHSTAPAFIATRAAITAARAQWIAANRKAEALDDQWGEAQRDLAELVALGLENAGSIAGAERTAADIRRRLDEADEAIDTTGDALADACDGALTLQATTPAEMLEKVNLYLCQHQAHVTARGRFSRGNGDSAGKERVLRSLLADLHHLVA